MPGLIKQNFSIIGAGNLGTHLIQALTSKGYPLTNIYKKTKFGCFEKKVTSDIDRLVQNADFIVIATQESQIIAAAQLIATSAHCNDKIVFHTCNALTSDQLICLKEKGAHTASFSPLQTFPAFDANIVEDVFTGISFLSEGDEQAVALTAQLATDLGAKLIKVEKEKKIYFHIAGVAASNFLISILKLAEQQLLKTSDSNDAPDIEILMPLIRQTLKNAATKGVAASLTGPFKRKELGIIAKHLEHLEPEEAVLYKALTQFLAT
jgi:predicted short-subunit dehydrogenase-like oxidoreductase (DUF2520 family)